MMSEQQANPGSPSGKSDWPDVNRWAWWCLPLVLIAIAVEWATIPRQVIYSPWYLLGINFLMPTLIPLFSAYLVGRMCLNRGNSGLILLVAGLVVWGVSGFGAATSARGDANILVAIRNLSLWLSGLCQLGGTVLMLRLTQRLRHVGLWITAAWAVAVGAVVVIVMAVERGITPVFFVEGEGGTPVRYIVLSSAIAFFALAATMMRLASRSRPQRFLRWYGLGLMTNAVGLVAGMLAPSIGSPMIWTGWLIQLAGMGCTLLASILGAADSRISLVPLSSQTRRCYPYGVAIAAVLAGAVIRGVFLEKLGTKGVYVTFYPAVVVAALYGGLRSGILATVLAGCLGLFLWIEPVHRFGGKDSADWLSMMMFLLSGAVIAWVTEAMRRAQERTHQAETLAELLAERERARDALRKSELEFRSLFDNAMDAVFLTATDGTINAANRAACDMFGMSEEELCRGGRSAILSLDNPRLEDALAERERIGKARVELSFVRKDGTKFPAEVTSVLLDREERRAFVMIQDITKRKAVEHALRVAAREWQSTFDAVQSAVWLMDRDRRVLRCNKAASRTYNVTSGDNCCERMHGTLGVVLECPFTRVLQTGQRQTEILAVRDRWLEVNVDPIVDDAGQTVGAVHAVTDITARKRAEDALRDSEERYHRVFEAESDAIVMVDCETQRFMEANVAALTLYGYSHEEMLKLTGVDVSAEPEKTRQAISQGLVKIPIRWHRKKDGTVFPVEIAGNYFEYRGRKTHVAVIRDITDRERAQEELLSSRGQLRALAGRLQAVREEERTHIAREIHDVLAQDLTRLKIEMSWLLRRLTKPGETPAPETLAARVSEMHEIAHGAIGFVQRIATELRPVVLDSLGLCAAVEWQVREFQERTEIQCAADVPEEELPLSRDCATAMFRILQESLTNVARHAHATRVEVLLCQNDGHVVLRVQDNGCGISAEALNNAMSIGLAGMRERALLLGGQLDIWGQFGAGTTLEVRLPIFQNQPQSKS